MPGTLGFLPNASILRLRFLEALAWHMIYYNARTVRVCLAIISCNFSIHTSSAKSETIAIVVSGSARPKTFETKASRIKLHVRQAIV
jgi:hypothetical protein